MELKPDLQAVQRSTRRLALFLTFGLLAVLLVASTVSVVVWNKRSRPSAAAVRSQPSATLPVASLAGAAESGPSAGGEVVPTQKRLVPQVGHALIRYFQPQSAQPPH